MDRRRFLVGLGRFAGAALIVPTVPTIFDMGRDTGIAAPVALGGLEGAGFAIANMPDHSRYAADLDKSIDDYQEWLRANLQGLGWNREPRTGDQLVTIYKSTPDYQRWYSEAVAEAAVNPMWPDEVIYDRR